MQQLFIRGFLVGVVMINADLDADLFQGEQKIPADPAPIIYQMRKPQMKKKVRAKKPSVAVARHVEKTTDRRKSTNVEIEKKIESLLKANQQLKESKDTLCAEIDELKKQRNFVELERDRVQQLWAFSKNELSRQKDHTVDIEKRVHKMSTEHGRQVALLHKRIRTLALNARMYCLASTQTDPILGTDGKRSVGVQTVEELTRERILDVLRGGDRQLAEYIAEIVKEKLHAQSEYKHALVNLEQRLKYENDVQVRKLREEKLKQFEEMSRVHREQLGELHAKYLAEKEQNEEQVNQLQMENRILSEKIDALERETKQLKGDLLKCESEKRVLRDENQAISGELQKRRLESAKHQKDATIIKELKKKLLKSEDIKEIVLGEFRKLERERNELANGIADGVRRVELMNRDKTQRFFEQLMKAEKEVDDFEAV
ncbi:hypothetical protein Tcan_14033 [Toxocara canis]|uniref:Uncharacterized protein n=1 Tax=Toxocara canis TaxID=6265 RepID=A0A0B2VLS8_TOXCA|nr:hypothetical protein Tcan_14033 [Toxocara canis]